MSDALAMFDAIVVGGGPAGIACAVTLGEGGKSVALVDDSPRAGGQIWRHSTAASIPPAARAWLARLDRCTTVTHLSRSRIIATTGPRTFLADTPAGPQMVRGKSVVLATGARERFLPFPGWTLPGVLGAGAVQALIKSGLNVHGKRVIVAGTGPLLLAVAELLTAKGASVPLILEQTTGRRVRSFGASLWRSPGKLAQAVALRTKLWRTGYATNAYPQRVEAADDCLQVTFTRNGRSETRACDLFACGFHLVPNTELAGALGCTMDADGFVTVDPAGQTSVPKVYAAGELTGIGGVDKAVLEGQLIAAHLLNHSSTQLQAAVRGAQQFMKGIDRAFALRPELFELAEADTIVCRCEDVPRSRLAGCVSVRDAKLQTRCGMGPCQGRVCGSIVQKIFNEPTAVLARPPLMPATVAALAHPGAKSPAAEPAATH